MDHFRPSLSNVKFAGWEIEQAGDAQGPFYDGMRRHALKIKKQLKEYMAEVRFRAKCQGYTFSENDKKLAIELKKLQALVK